MGVLSVTVRVPRSYSIPHRSLGRGAFAPFLELWIRCLCAHIRRPRFASLILACYLWRVTATCNMCHPLGLLSWLKLDIPDNSQKLQSSLKRPVLLLELHLTMELWEGVLI